MESDALPGGMYGHDVQPGMVGLEMSLNHQNPQHNHHTMMSHPHQEADYNSAQAQQSSEQGPSHPVQTKPLIVSDDDENNNSVGDDKVREMSGWHRMKWTDYMVRLLIMLVYYIGDEVVSEPNDPSGSKKKGGGVLQKKGKWKAVSRAMLERGFHVSPQQCEDKFNDMNKRYKRVNDILGKGTACRVVENQSLLETMDHLSPKTKEEVKKLLNSKHLFFREMCAYHNSCGQNNGGGVGAGNNVASQTAQTQQRRSCLHKSKEKSVVVQNNSSRFANKGSKMVRATNVEDRDDGDDDEEEEEDGDDHEEGEEDGGDEDEGGSSRVVDDGSSSKKRIRVSAFVSPLHQQLDAELANILHDSTMSSSEKRQWMMVQLIGLEEQRVDILSKALDNEKQGLKWLKFRSKKEREMEREKLTIERRKLENERMVLLIRRKEMELIEQQRSSNKRSDPSTSAG